MLQRIGKLIDILAENADFVFAVSAVTGFKIQMAHPFRNVRQLQNRRRHPAGNNPDHNTADNCWENTDACKERIRNFRTVPDSFQRTSYNKKVSARQNAPAFYIFHLRPAVWNACDNIIIAVFHNLVLLAA